MHTQNNQTAAILTGWAQNSAPTALGPVFATIGDWAATSGAQLRENLHTLAAEAVCGAGEYAMKRRGRRDVGQFAPRKAARAFRAVLPAWAAARVHSGTDRPGPRQ